MKLKKILTTLAILGSLNACTSAPKSVPQIRFSEKATSFQKDKTIKNYQTLSAHADRWFISKNNTKQLQEVLKCLVSTRRGQELLNMINYVPRLEVGSFGNDATLGRHIPMGGNASLISIAAKYFKQNTLEQNAAILMHELTHRVQQEKNLGLNRYFSVEQGCIVKKLCEAETFGWDEVVTATFAYKKAYPNALDVKGLTPAIALDIGRKAAIREKRKFNESAFMQTDPLYKLAQAMVQTGGNVERAEKIVVGKNIQQCMAKSCARSEVRCWRNHYDLSTCRQMPNSIYMYSMTTIGNDEAFNKVIDYYSKTYGIDKSSINKLYLTDAAIKYKKRFIDDDLTIKALKGFDKKYLRDRNRLSRVNVVKSLE